MLRPLENIMVLHSLHYQDEILSHNKIQPSKQQIKPEEMEMATNLISLMATSFSPEKYTDDYAVSLKKLVAAKMQGVEIKALKAPKIEITDLMSALRASVEAAQKDVAKKPVTVVAARK